MTLGGKKMKFNPSHLSYGVAINPKKLAGRGKAKRRKATKQPMIKVPVSWPNTCESQWYSYYNAQVPGSPSYWSNPPKPGNCDGGVPPGSNIWPDPITSPCGPVQCFDGSHRGVKSDLPWTSNQRQFHLYREVPAGKRFVAKPNESIRQRTGVGTSAPASMVLPKEVQKTEKEAKLAESKDKLVNLWWYSSVITVPLAWVLSYHRNESLVWSFLSGIVATPYVIYRGIEYGLYERKK